ncbi:MAG: hypothetical protein WBP29_07655 [Candidatus Zixiibacteriota bacterium]
MQIELRKFAEGVSSANAQFGLDCAMLERSLELSSKELMQFSSDLREIFKALPDLFFRLDEDGKILDRKAGARTKLFSS